MSLECGFCERDLRGDHAEDCPRHPRNRKKRNSREPIRKGKVYCSPGCGYGCLFEDYEEARTSAAELAAELGEGWEPRVWENLGWCYEARLTVDDCVPVTIHKDKHSEEYFACGLAVYVQGSTASTPRACAEKVIENLSGFIERATNMQDAIVYAMRKEKGDG